MTNNHSHDSTDLTSCDREAIHLIGSIQPHGALIAASRSYGGVTHLSANAPSLLAVGFDELFGAPVSEFMPEGLRSLVEETELTRSAPSEFYYPLAWRGQQFDAALHVTQSHYVVELERSDFNYDDPLAGPIRNRRWAEQLEAAATWREALQAAVTEVRALTGYDRVMAYRFEEDNHGWVAAESRRDDWESYLDLHYPASDIPQPARRLLLASPLRQIPDVEAPAVPILDAERREAKEALDLTQSHLRRPSSIHLQYLENMGVRASLTASLVVEGRLWGLIACHHGSAFALPRSKQADVLSLAQLLARKIDSLAVRGDLRHHDERSLLEGRIVHAAEKEEGEAVDPERSQGIEPFIKPHLDRLLSLVAADGLAVFLDGEFHVFGRVPAPEAMRRILEISDRRQKDGAFSSSRLSEDLPEVSWQKGDPAGMLVHFTSGQKRSAVFWFRDERVSTVQWAGDPNKSVEAVLPGNQTIAPRQSFEAWQETIQGASRAWDPLESESAATLGNLILARWEQLMRGQAERAVAALMDNLPGLVFLLDEDGRMLRWNQRIEQQLGYSAEQIASSHASELIAPEDRALALERIGLALAEESAQAELEVLYRSGERVPHFFTARRLVFGGLPCVLGVGVDISRQREAERHIRQQAELLDKARDAIAACDLELRVTYWNKSAERLYGWEASEAVGRSVRDLHHRDSPDFERLHAQALEKGEATSELSVANATGGTLITETRWTLVREEDGQPSRILEISTDVTHQKKMEQQSLHAQRMESIGTLASGMAHNLNNTLAPITLSIDLLKLKVSDRAGLQMLDRVEQAAKRGAEMISRVLSIARGVEGQRVRVGVAELISEVAGIVRDTFAKNITLRVELSHDLWTVQGDPAQLHQVLLNLCVNARDAMPSGGELTISAENLNIDEHFAALNLDLKTGPHVAISVEDSGSGIPQGILDRIFDPFFTTKEQGKGTGLGLSTSLSIVKSHGGALHAYSEVGVGSRFRIYLPAGKTEDKVDDTPSQPQFSNGHGELVLIVDDEAPLRDLAKQALESFGYRVLTASNGAEAVTVFTANSSQIDVVLLDMMMPVMDGPATIKALMKLDPDVSIIAASGVVSNGNEARAAGIGVRHFLAKPYTVDTLLAALSEVIAFRKSSNP